MTQSVGDCQIVTWNDLAITVVERPENMVSPTWASSRDFAVVIWERISPTARTIWRWRPVYQSPQAIATNAAVAAELDRVFTNIVSGKLERANLQLQRLASDWKRDAS